MATLTPEIATQLMQRSMTTGVPTSELEKYGGYQAVKSAYENAGGPLDTSQMSAADLKAAAQQVANTGVGDMSLLERTGTQLTDAGRAAMVRNGTASAATSGAASGAASGSTVGYSGLANAKPAEGVNLRELVEKSTGQKIDNWFYDEKNPNYAANQAALTRAGSAMYGNVGANKDARDWTAIMAADDPLKAAEDALKAMYSDKAYLAANADHVLQQGYLPEQADYTYKQMADRVGSTYDPNWSQGTRFEGKINTAEYLNNVDTMSPDALAEYTRSRWQLWGGDPTSRRGLADMTNSANSVFNANAATNAGTFAPVNSGNTATTQGSTTGDAATAPGSTTGSSTTGTGLLTGSTSGSTTGSPTTGTGLISGADNLSGSRAMTPTQTGSAGLITANMLTTPKAPTIQLPGGPVTPQTAPAGSWNFGSPQPAGAPQVKSGIVTWTNPATGQRVTYPAGTPSPGAGWVMG